MMLNPQAKEFQPTAPIGIPLPEDPWSQMDDIAVSPEDAAELEEVQNWVQMMADFEESESDHLISLAMRYADKSRLADVKERAAKAGLSPSRHGHLKARH